MRLIIDPLTVTIHQRGNPTQNVGSEDELATPYDDDSKEDSTWKTNKGKVTVSVMESMLISDLP
jgi:hypothetical protein